MNNYVPLTYRAGDVTALHVQWIPRSLNVYADNISRIIDHDDWSTTSEFYDHLNTMYAPSRLTVLLNAENFIRDIGVRVLPASMLSALIGQTKTVG